MKFTKTKIEGAFIWSPEKKADDRGNFSRVWDRKLFAVGKINFEIDNIYSSYNLKKGTLRGLHYQEKPYSECKIVRCVKGEIFDVAVDLRKQSGTYKRWTSVLLSEKNNKLFFIPEGCAHGYLTLTDKTLIDYFVSNFYSAEAQRGIPYNDPNFNIDWPEAVLKISERDKNWPGYDNYR